MNKTIIDKIQESVFASTGKNLYYASAGEINRILDNEELPCAFLFLLQDGTITRQNGRYKEQANFAVFFVDRTDFDFNTYENEQVIDQCKRTAYKWLRSLEDNEDLQVVSINSSQRIYDRFDAILTGFAVNVTLSERIGINPDCEE